MSPQEMIDYKENVDKLSKEELVKEYCKLSRLMAKWHVMADNWMNSYSKLFRYDKIINNFKSTVNYLEEKSFIVQDRMSRIFEHCQFSTDTIHLSCFNTEIKLPKELLKIIDDNLYRKEDL